jgi:hypothetical protein
VVVNFKEVGLVVGVQEDVETHYLRGAEVLLALSLYVTAAGCQRVFRRIWGGGGGDGGGRGGVGMVLVLVLDLGVMGLEGLGLRFRIRSSA